MSKITNELWEIENERLRQEGLDEGEQQKRFDTGQGFLFACDSFSSRSNVPDIGFCTPMMLAKQAG